MRLDSDSYARLRDLVLSAAVPLIGESSTARAPGPSDADQQDHGADIGSDDRSGDEPWAWLIPVPEADLDRDFDRALERIAITFDAESLPTLQEVGDLVVFCGAGEGVLAGVGEVVGQPRFAAGATSRAKLRVLPLLLLDRARAPSIAEVAMTPRRLQTRLYPDTYERIRTLVTSAALQRPTSAEHGIQGQA